MCKEKFDKFIKSGSYGKSSISHEGQSNGKGKKYQSTKTETILEGAKASK